MYTLLFSLLFFFHCVFPMKNDQEDSFYLITNAKKAEFEERIKKLSNLVNSLETHESKNDYKAKIEKIRVMVENLVYYYPENEKDRIGFKQCEERIEKQLKKLEEGIENVKNSLSEKWEEIPLGNRKKNKKCSLM